MKAIEIERGTIFSVDGGETWLVALADPIDVDDNGEQDLKVMAAPVDTPSLGYSDDIYLGSYDHIWEPNPEEVQRGGPFTVRQESIQAEVRRRGKPPRPLSVTDKVKKKPWTPPEQLRIGGPQRDERAWANARGDTGDEAAARASVGLPKGKSDAALTRSMNAMWKKPPARTPQQQASHDRFQARLAKKRSKKVQESPLQQLVRLLREDDQNLPEKETGDSLDAQVDRYLSDYEASSRTAKHEGRDFRRTVKRLMSEAGDDDELDLGGDDAGGEAETETEPAPEPTKPSAGDIDIEEFANSVARLIQNYDTLLEVQSTLIRRATNFVSKNYDQTVIDGFETAMRDKHGLVDGETKQEVDDEMFAAPAADRAGPGGAGS